MSATAALGWFVVAVAAGGCGSEGGGHPDDTADVTDAGDVRAGDGAGGDVGDGVPADGSPESGTTDGPLADEAAQDEWVERVDIEPEDLGPMPPVTPFVEPTPLPVPKWLVAYVSDPAKDPIATALDLGTFAPPTGPGKDAGGVEWSERVPGENGRMGYAGYGLFYAVAVVELEPGEGIIVRADRFYSVWGNGSQLPGDPYLSRRHRLPVPGKPGGNVIVAMAYMAVMDPEIELWTTTAELYMNVDDLTAPDLVVGDPAAFETVSGFVGVAVLNLTDETVYDLSAYVAGSDMFGNVVESTVALAPGSVTQIAIPLVPLQEVAAPDQKVPVKLRFESHSLEWSYERGVELTSRLFSGAYKRTRQSLVDGSVQYYGVQPPTDFDPKKEYSLVLSLHGAGVDAAGQAGAYSAKDWAFIVAPTNRRPFGFDWEEWGRLDGIETLDDAQDAFNIDPSRVYVTGHSMGGHGTWQFGVLFPGRFAVVGPSAGWSSFYSYGGSAPPTGPFARARASSFTLNYVPNLTDKPVYIIHGDADDNVPISEAYLMAEAVEKVTDDFTFYIEPGAGHWWDGDASPGADCVDWPPLFELMQNRTIDPIELDFQFTTPSPWVTASYSFATIEAQDDPYEDSTILSSAEGDTVVITTQNVRRVRLDGLRLQDKGIEHAEVDGELQDVADGPLVFGPTGGKDVTAQGPFNQVFHRPFCFVYADSAPMYQRYVSYLVSVWNVIGNGHACAFPLSHLASYRAKHDQEHNLIYVGVPLDQVPLPDSIPLSWDDNSVTVGGKDIGKTALVFVFPEKSRLSAVMFAPAGAEHLLFYHQPFTSRSGLPDYTAWGPAGVVAAGFFTAEWGFDPALGVGL